VNNFSKSAITSKAVRTTPRFLFVSRYRAHRHITFQFSLSNQDASPAPRDCQGSPSRSFANL
jgi:hypothetical protein